MRRNGNEKRIGLGVSSVERRARGGTVDQTTQPIGRRLSGEDRRDGLAGISGRVWRFRGGTMYLYRFGSIDRDV